MKTHHTRYDSFIRFYKKVNNILSKARSKELLTFLFFLGLSAIFWLLQSMNEESEAHISVPIEYENIPADIRFETKPPAEFRVLLKDKGLRLLRYAFGRRIKPISINVSYYLHSATEGVLSVNPEHILSSIKNQLAVEAEILSVIPNPLMVSYARLRGKKLPIRFAGSVLPMQQYYVADTVHLYPDSMMVYATDEVLQGLHEIQTVDTVFYELNDTLRSLVRLQPIARAVFAEPDVRLYAPIQEYTEKTLVLPLEVLSVPDTLLLLTFPSSIQLSGIVNIDDFKRVNEQSFHLVVDYNDIVKGSDDKLPVRLLDYPSFMSNIRLLPDSVEYIIEEKELPVEIEIDIEIDEANRTDSGDRIG